MYHRRKVVFIGSSSNLLNALSGDYDTEVISSISFLDTLLFSFIPDMIIFDSMYDVDLLPIRKNPKLSFIPILVVAENFCFMNDFPSLLQVPGVMLCNQNTTYNEGILNRIKQIIDHKQRILPPRTGAIVKQAIFYINKNISNQIKRDDMADFVGVANAYLSRTFKKEMGLPLWDYVNEYRLREAKSLLIETGFSIKDIACKTGFSNATYFTRLFTRYFGETPGHFRQMPLS